MGSEKSLTRLRIPGSGDIPRSPDAAAVRCDHAQEVGDDLRRGLVQPANPPLLKAMSSPNQLACSAESA
jgi:hypothetical protein